MIRTLGVLALLASSAVAQTFYQGNVLTPAGTGAGDEVGAAVAVEGDVAVVCAQRKGTGTVFVYRRESDGTWSEEQVLTPLGINYRFGATLDVSGDVIAVGGGVRDSFYVGQHFPGSVHLYRWDGATWNFEAKVTGHDTSWADEFTTSLALSGDTLIVGSPGTDEQGLLSGSAYVFEYDGTTWSETQKILPSNGVGGLSFGSGMAIAGDRAVIGGTGASWEPGRAYVYERDASGWVEVDVIIDDGATGERFGSAVALDTSGRELIIGDPKDGDGAVTVFRHDGTSFIQEQKILAPPGAELFGAALALDDESAVVGAPQGYGGLYLLRKQEDDAWAFGKQIWLAGTPLSPDSAVGLSVDISNGTLFSGAPFDDLTGAPTNEGLAFFSDVASFGAGLATTVQSSVHEVAREIGGFDARTEGGSVTASLEFNLGWKHLDGYYDFRWITVQTDHMVNGVSESESPSAGLLPAITPPASVDLDPFVYDAATWAAGITGSETIHDEGRITAVFPSPAPVASNVIDAYTSVVVATPLGSTDVIPLAGFRWLHDGFDNASVVLGLVDGPEAAVLVDAALFSGVDCGAPHAGCPGFVGWTAIDAPLVVPDSLFADVTELSVATGGQQVLTLDGGPICAGHEYFVLGSVSGTSPPFNFGSGAALALVPDTYFTITLSPIAGVHDGFQSTLDGAGTGTAIFTLPATSNPLLVGLTFHHVFVARAGSAVVFASNPVSVTLTP